MCIIKIENLKKKYIINKKSPGIKGVFKNFFSPKKTVISAVDGININVLEGEIIGLIGPNGAGKSTIIKMLTGILVPTSGVLEVNGNIPYKNRKKNAKKMGVIFGQKTQLWQNLPLKDSYELLKTIYQIPHNLYKKNIKLFDDILGIGSFLDIPVRLLSLGQRMRSEIAACLLHDPKIVFLDEPTIGLDIIAKEKIREFILNINKEKKTTIILTTHDMSDIERLCQRIVILDKGKILYDGFLKALKERFDSNRIIVLDFKEPVNIIDDNRINIKSIGLKTHIFFNKNEISTIDLLKKLSQKNNFKDFIVKGVSIDKIISQIYESRDKIFLKE